VLLFLSISLSSFLLVLSLSLVLAALEPGRGIEVVPGFEVVGVTSVARFRWARKRQRSLKFGQSHTRASAVPSIASAGRIPGIFVIPDNRQPSVRSGYEARSHSDMWFLIIAAGCAGLFAGAAIYITAVEHPARLSCGTPLAVREFAPSYHRATLMQVPLAATGCMTGSWSAWQFGDAWVALGAVLLIAVVPFTLVVILPTNKQLLDPALDPVGERAAALLARWGRLHAMRVVLSSAAFAIFLARLGR
jgi:hypothetical protein